MNPVSETEVAGPRQGQPSAFLPGFGVFAWRVTALHMLTYFLAGIVAMSVFHYETLFETQALSCFMRPVKSVWVAFGPGLQVFRGLLFAVVLYPIADTILSRRRGWLILWGLFLGLATLGTVGPSPGSFEGMAYTKVPLITHLTGLPEVVTQTLLFSLGLVAWCRRPARWMNVLGIIAVVLIVLMSGLGALAAAGLLPKA